LVIFRHSAGLYLLEHFDSPASEENHQLRQQGDLRIPAFNISSDKYANHSSSTNRLERIRNTCPNNLKMNCRWKIDEFK